MKKATTIPQRLIGISERIERVFIVRVIRDGLVTMIPILMIGAFALVLKFFPVPAYLTFIEEFADGLFLKMFDAVNKATFGVMSVYMTLSFSFSYFSIRHPEKSVNIWGIFTALCAFFILDGIASPSFSIQNLGATSVALAMISSISSSAAFEILSSKLISKRRTYSYGVDSRMNGAIASLFPSAIIISVTAFIAYLVTLTGRETVYQLFTDVFVLLFKPNFSIFGKGLEFITLTSFLWCFGIHGSDCLESVATELFVPLLDVNMNAVASGNIPTEILCKQFFDCFILMGGCGSSICLLIAILIFCKDKGMRGIAKTAAFPMLFNINELMVFGLPIVFNPILCIPFILTPITQYLITYFAFSMGIVPLITSSVEWTTPIILGGYVATSSIAGSILQLVNVLVGVAIYLPFVKMMEKIHLDRERANLDGFIAWYKENEEELSKIHLTEVRGIYGEIAKKLVLNLQTAIDEKRFFMHYQPQYNYQGKCVGVEALLRWPLIRYSGIYPPILIQLARECGKLETLEEYILERVVSERNEIFKKFGNDIKISVNVTGHSIANERYWNYLQSLYQATPFESGKLCIEITEQTAIVFTEELMNHFRASKELGIEFAIDDFSMGQTSVNYLKGGLFDYLKLDGSLVRGLKDNPRCREIISSIVQMANSLNVTTVAEYVETEEIRAVLHETGCDVYQGYLFSPAIPLNDSYTLKSNVEVVNLDE